MKRGPLLVLMLAATAVGLAGCATSPSQSTDSTHSPTTLRYEVFSNTLDFDEDALGLPYDIFTPDAIFARTGDTVIIGVHNIEKEDEDHTFTMGAPFNVNETIAMGKSATVTLSPTVAGIYSFICIYHQPTMSGRLIVID